jgi:hypothetical protein
VLLVLLQGLMLARDDWAVLRGDFAGPDDYMRLDRVVELYDSGGWYSAVLSRANTPYGQTIQWTRPVDALLLAGAAALTPVFGFRSSLHGWAVVISPLLHMAALLVLLWGARPLVGRRALVYAGILWLCQPVLLFYFLPARPDHHSLLYLLFTVLLGLGLRLVGADADRRTAAGAGLVGALAVWVSVESLIAVAWLTTALGIGWVVWREGLGRSAGWFSAGLLGGLVVAILLERPWGELATIEYQRLSLVHLVLAGLIMAFWLAVSALERWSSLCGRRAGRLAVAIAGAGIAIGTVWFFFPKFFGGPMVEVDARFAAEWIDLVVAHIGATTWADNFAASARAIVIYLGPVLPAFPTACVLARRRPAPEGRGWALLALGMATYVMLALFGPQGQRWAAYAAVLLVPPYAVLLTLILLRLGIERIGESDARTAEGGIARRIGTSLASVVTIIVFGVGFPILAALLPQPAQAVAKGKKECAIAAIAEHLNAGAYAERPQRILTLPLFGAELLYRTPHHVVATGFAIWSGTATGAAGLVEVHRFFSAADDETAHQIVRERGIDLVLTCPYSNEHLIYARDDGASSFYQRLVEGELPGWLGEEPLPDALSRYYRLFRVAK